MEKSLILKENHVISNLVKRKQSVGSKYYAIYYGQDSSLKVAFSISKKYGKAFERNYGKRVTKEVFRQLMKEGKITEDMQYKMLFVIKPTSKSLTYQEKVKQIKFIINIFLGKIK